MSRHPNGTSGCYTSCVEFQLIFTTEASAVLDDLEHNPMYAKKHKKVLKALGFLEQDPRHPGLQSHPYSSIDGPNGETLWDSYIENNTPSAWRIFWCYGPGKGQITIVTIGPHPD